MFALVDSQRKNIMRCERVVQLSSKASNCVDTVLSTITGPERQTVWNRSDVPVLRCAVI